MQHTLGFLGRAGDFLLPSVLATVDRLSDSIVGMPGEGIAVTGPEVMLSSAPETSKEEFRKLSSAPKGYTSSMIGEVVLWPKLKAL